MSGELPTFRSFDAGETEGLVALWRNVGLLRPWNDPHREIRFACRDAHSTILVAGNAGAPVASVMVGEDGHRGWLYYVAVATGLRGRGLGRAAVAAAEDWLERRGVWKSQLLVREDNADARGFYGALGYRDTRSSCLQRVIGTVGPASHPDGAAP